jgi:HSP20 family molecular chaperone IbpA
MTQQAMANGNGGQSPEKTRTRRERVPPVDIYENENELLLVSDMPGVTSEGLSIHIEAPELRIEGQVDGQEGVIWVRTFSIDERIAAGDVSAELKHGVLTIHLPKSADLKPRKVQIKAS